MTGLQPETIQRLSLGREAPALAVVFALTLAFFGSLEVARPAYFLWDDNATQNLPSYVYNWRAITGSDAEGAALAHVNLHQYLGQIWLGNGQSGALYLPVYVAAALAQALLGDLRPTIDVLAVAHLLLGAIGFYWLLRSLAVSRLVAVIGALLWATLPFHSQVGRNWIFAAYVAGLAPWNLWALLRLATRPGAWPMLLLAAIKALLFYAGHANYAVMVAVFDGLVLATLLIFDRDARRRWLSIGGYFLGALALTGALAAPLLLPMLEAQQLSAYRTGKLSFAEFLSNPLRIWVFVKSQFFSMEPQAIHQSFGSLYYFGLWNLGLLTFGLLPSARRRLTSLSPLAPVFGMASLLAFALSTRAAAVFYPLPLLSSFRWPFKHYLFFLLFATVAASLVCDAIWRSSGGWSPRWRTVVVALFASGVVLHATIVLNPRWDRAFGPYRIAGSVEETTETVRSRLADPDRGRVISLWQTHREATPEHITHAYASLLGVRHIGGYDPLIAADNLQLALRLDYSNIFRYLLDSDLLDYLSLWNVRHLVAPADPAASQRLGEWPQLREQFRNQRLQVWENTEALPMVSFAAQPSESITSVWRVNGVDVSPQGRSGNLRIALAPLPWWSFSIDGGEFSPVAFDSNQQMSIEIPTGTSSVRIRYRNIPFRLGCGVLAATLVSLVAISWRRRLAARSSAVAKGE